MSLWQELKNELYHQNAARFDNKEKIENTIKIINKVIDDFQRQWRCDNCKFISDIDATDPMKPIGKCLNVKKTKEHILLREWVETDHYCKNFKLQLGGNCD